ncbi:hypothetical protein [Streptomyces sp. MNP-20]|uniref:hypothetical protein n=1 Tax=Streptomyces sp. MNP-20 TaxID=2721165 RepID=UPI0015528C57|nr:hypothetical protein [Streptomyces sp. MNP-20]
MLSALAWDSGARPVIALTKLDVAEDSAAAHAEVTGLAPGELLVLPGGGVLIGTPGLRGIGLQGAAEGVEQVFAEIHEYARGCAFRDRTHAAEPGCAVQEALADGQLSERRPAGYRKLHRESARVAARASARPTGKRSELHKSITRHQRATRRFFDQQQ